MRALRGVEDAPLKEELFLADLAARFLELSICEKGDHGHHHHDHGAAPGTDDGDEDPRSPAGRCLTGMLSDDFKRLGERLGRDAELDGTRRSLAGVPVAPAPREGNPLDAVRDAVKTAVGADSDDNERGTSKAPFTVPARGETAVSEYSGKAYVTLAFPTLFPFGRGHGSEVREVQVSAVSCHRHLMAFYDVRFATHPSLYVLLLQHTATRRGDEDRNYLRQEQS